MNVKCPNCRLVNFIHAEKCVRCGVDLDIPMVEAGQKVSSCRPSKSLFAKIIKRGIACVAVCAATIFIFYLSLIFTAEPLSAVEKQSVKNAIAILKAKGFTSEVFLLNKLAVLRAGDNWLNASTLNETAYAATNFPFEVVIIYPGFFDIPKDDTERAMVLLHEAQHLKGADEKQAYEFVWKNRKKLGWTKDKYADSIVWRNVRKQTKEFAPNLFVCDSNEYSDCTEQ